MRAYSQDLRERVLADFDAGMGTLEVAAKYRVSQSWLRRLKQRRRTTGSTLPMKPRYGRVTKWSEHAEMLAEIVGQTPDITLEELKAKLSIDLSISTFWRAVKALGLSLKKSPESRRTRSSRCGFAASGLAR
jgi:transposase